MSGQYLDLNHVISGKVYNKITNDKTGAHIFVGVAQIVSKHNEPLRVKFTSGNVTHKPQFFTYYDSNKKPNLFTETFSGGKRTRKMKRRKSRRTRR
jgi:hypothetical protein